MDNLSPFERSKQMSLIRSKNTKPEIAVRQWTHGMGYRYRLHAMSLPGSPDMVFKSRRKVIFVHGCFWHSHQNCSKFRLPKSRQDYWKPKLENNAKRDRQVRQKLWRLGWGSLVVWECALKNPDKVKIRIRKFLDREERA